MAVSEMEQASEPPRNVTWCHRALLGSPDLSVTVSYALAGADEVLANYELVTETSTDEASITKALITVVGTTAADKIYDGDTDADITLGTVYGVADGDTVTVTATGAFETANAGTNKNVTVEYSLDEALVTSHDSRVMTSSPSPCAWRPDFPGAAREAP